MNVFVGREPELARLERALDGVRRTGGGSLLSIRGRRRVGKSRLVEEFIQRSGCPAVFYTAVQGPGPRELGRFLETIAGSDAPAGAEVRAGATANSWEAALALAVRGATAAAPVVLVIDEFPYLAAKAPTIEAELQLLWDRTFQREAVLVVLVGSDRATMEALTEQGRPLYDRARELVVKPFAPSTVGALLDLPPAEALDAYAVIGGFPVLALEWGRGRSREEYLADAAHRSQLIPGHQRREDARGGASRGGAGTGGAVGGRRRRARPQGDPHAHGTAAELAGPRDRRADRQGRRGSPDALLRQALAKNRRYVVADPYLRFWLRFVAGAIDTIDRGRGELILADVRRDWSTFRGRAIEPIVRDGLEQLLPDERFGAARYVGGWWNRNNSIEVDLVGAERRPVAERVDFVGSVKWRDGQPFDRHDGAVLAGKRLSIPGADTHTKLLGVSRQGFTPDRGLDIEIGPEELIAAFGRSSG